MPVFSVGEWLPDQPTLGIVGADGEPFATVAKNVLPVTASSYGPVPSTVIATGGALLGRCQGLYGMYGDDRIGYLFAGDDTGLYAKVGDSNGFTAIGSGYATPVPGNGGWSITSFGVRIIATNYTDPIQTYLIGTDLGFTDLSADAPKARYAAVIRDFLMVGNTDDSVDGVRRSRVWWPAIGDPQNWPTPGTNAAIQVQSDFQDLQQSDLGAITGIVGGVAGVDGLIFCERGIYTATYQGSPTIFSFSVAEGASGTRSPMSIVKRHYRYKDTVVAVAYYLGEDGFYANDGTSSVPIGASRINKWFFDNLNPDYPSYVVGTSDPVRQIIVWGFPGLNSLNGMLDTFLVYNWNLNRFSYFELPNDPLETLSRAMATGFTLDQMDQFGNTDDIAQSFDLAFWIGGGMQLGGFNGLHQLVRFGGSNLAPLIETVEMQPSGGRRTNVMMVRPLTDGVGATVATGHRELLSGVVNYEPAVAVNAFGTCPQFASGRYIRFRLGLPAGTAFSHIHGVDTADREMIPAGRI